MSFKPCVVLAIMNYFFCIFAEAGFAQVQVNQGSATEVTVSGADTALTITGGVTRGTNLFHSFESFSLLSGPNTSTPSAIFLVNPRIENVIARVNGNQPSIINGRLSIRNRLSRNLSNASLFLLNPKGISFGPGRTLILVVQSLPAPQMRLVLKIELY